jgi:DNA-directed RNA polymerase sigma subunit (sigma70/sigma32)
MADDAQQNTTSSEPLPSQALRDYRSEAESFPALSDTETRLLFQKMRLTTSQEDKKNCKDQITRSYLTFVIDMAESYTDIELILVDFIQEGNIALLEAIDTYTPETKESFLEFITPIIHKRLQNYIEENPLPPSAGIQIIPAGTEYEGEEKEE